MEVLDPRAALLSNYEVLTWLRELESEHLLRTKTALRVKKEEEAATTTNGFSAPSLISAGSHLEASENLRTVEVEAIGYLSSDYLPTPTQSEEGITKLVKNLGSYDLTKAEKLQIVNLVPTLPVELYVIVEELEDRLGEQLDEILGHVEASLPLADPVTTNGLGTEAHNMSEITSTAAIVVEEDQQWDEDADAVFDEEYFDDSGTGAGVEGDLEMDEE